MPLRVGTGVGGGGGGDGGGDGGGGDGGGKGGSGGGIGYNTGGGEGKVNCAETPGVVGAREIMPLRIITANAIRGGDDRAV